jgi:hypothetical protein
MQAILAAQLVGVRSTFFLQPGIREFYERPSGQGL